MQDTCPQYVWPCLTGEGSGETQKNYGQTCPHTNSIHFSMCMRPFSCWSPTDRRLQSLQCLNVAAMWEFPHSQLQTGVNSILGPSYSEASPCLGLRRCSFLNCPELRQSMVGISTLWPCRLVSNPLQSSMDSLDSVLLGSPNEHRIFFQPAGLCYSLWQLPGRSLSRCVTLWLLFIGTFHYSKLDFKVKKLHRVRWDGAEK